MGFWSDTIPGCYIVNINEIDTAAADKFSNDMIKETNGEEMLHNRYSFGRDARVEKAKIGKYGEEAFRVFLREVCGLETTVDYDIWEGSRNVDKNDVFINGLNIDVKCSRDNQNRGLDKCYKQLNFMVPKTQSVKDITVWGFCDSTMTWFYIMSWVAREDYLNRASSSNWGGCDNWKLPLREGNGIDKLVPLLK